jgi:hypothetical protein
VLTELSEYQFSSLNDFKNVFSIKDLDSEIIQKVLKDWKKDAFFAQQFLRGLNPMTIRHLSKLDMLTDLKIDYERDRDSLEKIFGVSLEVMIQEKRLFFVDYSLFLDIPLIRGRVTYPSFGLFYFDTHQHELLPVMICLRDTFDTYRTFFPPGKILSELPEETQEHVWTLAKMYLTSADANSHEMLSHLLYTHLTIESIIIATHRNFQENSFVKRILVPHFKGTLAINTWGREQLLQTGGVFDLVSPFAMNGFVGEV